MTEGCGGLHGWQYLFVFLGGITAAYSCIFWVPPMPAQAARCAGRRGGQGWLSRTCRRQRRAHAGGRAWRTLQARLAGGACAGQLLVASACAVAGRSCARTQDRLGAAAFP